MGGAGGAGGFGAGIAASQLHHEATSDNAITDLIARSAQSLIDVIIRYNLAIFTQ